MESLMCLKKSSPSNYNLCIFCQKRKVNDDVREGGEQGLATVRTAMNSRKEFRSTKNIDVLDRVDEALGRSNVRILWHRTCYAQYTDKNKVIAICLAGVNDLIAAGIKVPSEVLEAFFKSTARAKENFKDSDVALIWLCNELHFCANKGKILELDTVWNRYVDLANEARAVILKSFLRRRSTFKEKLITHVRNEYCFFCPPDMRAPEKDSAGSQTVSEYHFFKNNGRTTTDGRSFNHAKLQT